MICACIDIGTNTTRVLVADAHEGKLTEVLQQRAFTQLGPGAGPVAPAKIAEVARVVVEQRALAERAGARMIRAVATAALRRCDNRGELMDAVRAASGVEIDVLDGADEARLAFLGATSTLPEPPAGRGAVVDVGGGSTEIAVGTVEGGVGWFASVPVGSALLAAACGADPPAPQDLVTVRERAAAAFAELDPPVGEWAVAVGGSAASMPRLVGPVLDEEALERALAALCAAPAADVAEALGLAAERVRLLPAGILVLDAAARRLGKPLRIGRGGLREGVLLELAADHDGEGQGHRSHT
jgi:exopolyphosphatase/guanosine-5'-triphosphate,3'-diphosphate pyrophosphatase